jgi:hypothetical protein
MRRFAHSARDEAIRCIKGAVDGEFAVKARSILQEAIDVYKQAKPGDKIFNTNYWSGYPTPQSDLYRRTIFDLAASGVDITRVFIEGDSFTDDEKKRQRDEMDRLKDRIHVRFVTESLLTPEARVNFLFIYDKIVGYAISARNLNLVNDIQFYTRREELDKAKELAETVIRLSEEYK